MTQPEKLFTIRQIAKALADVGTAAIQPPVVKTVLNALEEIGESHEARTLRYKLKTANKELGRAGHRIYDLRAQLAEVRDMISGHQRSSYRTLLQQNRELREIANGLRTQLNDAAIGWVPRKALEEANGEADVASQAYVDAVRGPGGLTL